MFFSPFSIGITSLGEERASLGAFRTFVRFAFVWFCLGRAAVCDCGTPWNFLLPFFAGNEDSYKILDVYFGADQTIHI